MCLQINSYSKFDMQISMQREYGVLLDRHKNRMTTYAWDTLQSVVCEACYENLLRMSYNFS